MEKLTVEIIYLAPGEQLGDADYWMLVEADGTGDYLATGAGRAPDGNNVYYSERGPELEEVLRGASQWCADRNIARIHVQRTA